MQPRIEKVAFVSTRIAGTDGVSLEIEKWAAVLERMGIECFYIAGEFNRSNDHCRLIEEAHFNHPDILSISTRAFEDELRSPELTEDIQEMARLIKSKLKTAFTELEIDAIIV